MKKIITIFFAVVSICWGQTNSVIIKLTDGTTKIYDLSEVREITLDGIPTDVAEGQIAQNIMQSFNLYQNYPNPFNPSTNIKYEIPESGLVDINIYDIQGKLVKSLSSGYQQGGNHTIMWDGKNNSGILVSSGTYFCNVRFKDKYQTKKLLLVK